MRRLESLLTESASRGPESPALSVGDDAVAYAELDALANRTASALRELGVARGDRVALWLPKSVAAVATTQAALRLGAAYVPIDPLSPPARARTIMDDCDVTAALVGTGDEPFLTRERERAVQREAGPGALPWQAVEQLPADPPPGRPPTDADALAYILYTSGSTGRPKGVCISHRNALAFVEWAVAEVGVVAADRLSNHAPLHFDLSVFDLYGAFAAGALVAVVPEHAAYAPQGLVEFVRGARISVWYSVPSALILMIERGDLLEPPPADLRAVLFAGEPFPVRYVRELRRHMPRTRLLNLYGPTETNVCTFHEVGEVPDDRTVPVPIGRASSGDVVRAVRDDGSEAAVGETGELVVEGPTVMLGYWGGPPQGREPYRTGDLVRRISTDEYEYLGRRDHMVKVRGHRIELGEVEACLSAHPAIAAAAAVVQGDGIQARLVAFCVPHDGDEPSLVELKRHCAERLPRYMVVDRVRFLDELPRTSTGKVDRRQLAETKEP